MTCVCYYYYHGVSFFVYVPPFSVYVLPSLFAFAHVTIYVVYALLSHPQNPFQYPQRWMMMIVHYSYSFVLQVVAAAQINLDQIVY